VYQERFGAILHHNVDKILLCGGSSRAAFGGGEVLAPVELYLAGRASNEHQGERIPIAEIAVEACRAWLRANLPELDVDRHVMISPRIRPGSSDLTRLFARGADRSPLANDTSCGAGFAPLTDLERTVLEVERALNSDETKRVHPAIGRDVKVMGVRRGSRISLTIGCAIIGRFVADIGEYERAKATATEIALAAAQRVTNFEVEAAVNAADDTAHGDVFLTVTGTSAEAGDDGEVGRGNRTSGLITPYRSMTLEAAAGKNPVSHVGKLYNLTATAIAAAITGQIPTVVDATCVLVSQIGRPVDDPKVVDVRLTLVQGARLDDVTAAAGNVVREELARLPELRKRLLDGQVRVY
jgi:S-adenosylmethionine synthetase